MANGGKERTVYVVDDDPAVLDSLQEVVESAGYRSEACASAEAFLQQYDASRPSCLVLDVCMPGMSGLELQERLRAEKIEIPIIIITGHGDVSMAVRSLKDGAFDFIEKPFQHDVLLQRISSAIGRDAEQRVQRAKVDVIRRRLASLSDRERQVMEYVVGGYSNRLIAEALGITQRTVEVHRAHVMEKFAVKSVAALVRDVMRVRPDIGQA